MSYEAQEIVRLLKNWPGVFVSPGEIGRRVDRKRFDKEPNWARAALRSMVDQGILENDSSGGFRLKEGYEKKMAA